MRPAWAIGSRYLDVCRNSDNSGLDPYFQRPFFRRSCPRMSALDAAAICTISNCLTTAVATTEKIEQNTYPVKRLLKALAGANAPTRK